MIFNDNLKRQLITYLGLLETNLDITYSLDNSSASLTMKEMLDELVSLSTRIKLIPSKLTRTPSFTLAKEGESFKVTFAGSPLGHEFNSLALALIQVGGRTPKLEQESINKIKNIKTPLNFVTYASLTCHNCPDVVQALNAMSVINPMITSTMVDGAIFKDEVEKLNIMAVPVIYLNDELFGEGRHSLEDILDKLPLEASKEPKYTNDHFDLLVIGGGPAGASAAIYGARKGISVGVVTSTIGGQVLDNNSIENLIGTMSTDGLSVANSLQAQMKKWGVNIIPNVNVTSITKDDLFTINLDNNKTIKSKTVIIATGSKWKNTGASGELSLKNKGVAYCPHCDGPLFEGKDVVVIGGGNSGVKAALDLSLIVKSVTLIEYMEELKADKVLVDTLLSKENVRIIKNAVTTLFNGETKLTSITIRDKNTNIEEILPVSGAFIQIGMIPSTDFIGTLVEKNKKGEIIVDKNGKTSLPGLFAAGDCTDSAYKQIIIAMGSGATAALSACEYLNLENI